MTGRDLRVGVRVSAGEMATLRMRAAAHRLPVGTYVRSVVLASTSPAGRSADAWWAELGEQRRIQVHRWLTEDRTGGPFPGQIPFTPEPAAGGVR